MAKLIKKAVVLMDNFKKTGSNGGVVIDVVTWNMDEVNRKDVPVRMEQPYENDKRYILINCSDKCKPGWILSSKHQVLVDSNEPPK
jgi:hypothetical protein